MQFNTAALFIAILIGEISESVLVIPREVYIAQWEMEKPNQLQARLKVSEHRGDSGNQYDELIAKKIKTSTKKSTPTPKETVKKLLTVKTRKKQDVRKKLFDVEYDDNFVPLSNIFRSNEFPFFEAFDLMPTRRPPLPKEDEPQGVQSPAGFDSPPTPDPHRRSFKNSSTGGLPSTKPRAPPPPRTNPVLGVPPPPPIGRPFAPSSGQPSVSAPGFKPVVPPPPKGSFPGPQPPPPPRAIPTPPTVQSLKPPPPPNGQRNPGIGPDGLPSSRPQPPPSEPRPTASVQGSSGKGEAEVKPTERSLPGSVPRPPASIPPGTASLPAIVSPQQSFNQDGNTVQQQPYPKTGSEPISTQQPGSSPFRPSGPTTAPSSIGAQQTYGRPQPSTLTRQPTTLTPSNQVPSGYQPPPPVPTFSSRPSAQQSWPARPQPRFPSFQTDPSRGPQPPAPITALGRQQLIQQGQLQGRGSFSQVLPPPSLPLSGQQFGSAGGGYFPRPTVPFRPSQGGQPGGSRSYSNQQQQPQQPLQPFYAFHFPTNFGQQDAVAQNVAPQEPVPHAEPDSGTGTGVSGSNYESGPGEQGGSQQQGQNFRPGSSYGPSGPVGTTGAHFTGQLTPLSQSGVPNTNGNYGHDNSPDYPFYPDQPFPHPEPPRWLDQNNQGGNIGRNIDLIGFHIPSSFSSANNPQPPGFTPQPSLVVQPPAFGPNPVGGSLGPNNPQPPAFGPNPVGGSSGPNNPQPPGFLPRRNQFSNQKFDNRKVQGSFSLDARPQTQLLDRRFQHHIIGRFRNSRRRKPFRRANLRFFGGGYFGPPTH